jgi:hypothetical protein
MVVGLFFLRFILPAVIVGFVVRRRASRAFAFVAMLLVSAVTAFVIWGSLRPLFTTEGLFVIAVHVLVALTVVGVRVPLISKIPSALQRSAN